MLLSCTPLSDRERAKTGSHHARSRRYKAKSKSLDTATTVDLTFPVRLKPLAEKFFHQALSHPAFVYMTASEIRQSIEHRVWSIAAKCPIWFGSGPATKREATEAQLAALAKAREAREQLNEEEVERERRIAERVEAITSA